MPSGPEASSAPSPSAAITPFAEQRRRELVDDYGVNRIDFTNAGAQLTVGELMERFFEAPVVQALIADPLAAAGWWRSLRAMCDPPSAAGKPTGFRSDLSQPAG